MIVSMLGFPSSYLYCRRLFFLKKRLCKLAGFTVRPTKKKPWKINNSEEPIPFIQK